MTITVKLDNNVMRQNVFVGTLLRDPKTGRTFEVTEISGDEAKAVSR